MSSKVMKGDCLDVLPTLEEDSFGAVVTDPPYARAGGQHNGRRSAVPGEADQFWCHWFAHVWSLVERVVRSDGYGFVFCDWRTLAPLAKAVETTSWTMPQALVWDREGTGMGTPFRGGYEMIGFVRGPDFRWDGPRNLRAVIRHRWTYGAKRLHPAEKPAELLRRLIALTKGPVLDPFSGSGSTLKACDALGREATGIEINPLYAPNPLAILLREMGES